MRPRRFVAAALVAGLLLPGAVHAAAPSEVTGIELLVLYERDTPAAEVAALNTLAGAQVTGTIEEVDLQRVVVAPGSTDLYRASPFVVAVQRPRIFHLMGPTNDPLVKLQWGLKAVRAFDAWRIETGKKSGVAVGVIDSGIDSTHVDLEGKIEPGYDFTEMDDDPYDDNGHGTHVSGIIAANVSNREGIAGLAPGVSIIPIKACLASDSCFSLGGYGVLAGVVEATRRGAEVLNLSLGGPGECDDISQAIFDWVHDQGTVTVAAAGNSGFKEAGNPTISPANCDHTIGVGATEERGRRAVFSSYGDFVDIAAPGQSVWSTYPPIASLLSPHLGYWPGSGTSMAAPHVAAAAALLKAHHPDWSPDQIQERLLATATDAGARGRDDRFGAGILNLFKALK